jgi:hypothetical protein
MAKKKKKSRLKKLLKGAALAGAAVLGAKAFGRRNQMKDYLKTEGGDKSDMRDYGPFSKGANYVPGPSKYVRSKTVLGKPGINRMDTSEVDLDYTAPSTAQYKNMDMGLEGYYKKGGRVGCGVAKKGFGKAMKKGGKK